MSDDDHDDECEAEYIFPPGGWTDCACWDRMTSTIVRMVPIDEETS